MGLDANIPEPVQKVAPMGDDRASFVSDPFDLRRMVATVWRSRMLLFACTAIALIIGFLHLERTTSLFTARADVLWEVSESTVVDITPVATTAGGSDFLLLESQIEIVRSNRLLGGVVDSLALTSNAYFNPYARPPDQRPLDLTSFTGIFRAIGLAAEADDPAPARQREIAIDRLREHLNVRWIENSYVLRLSASAPEAALSARLANAIAEAYIVDQLEKKFDATRAATTWLSERVSELRASLEDAERAVEDYSAASELVSEEALEASARQIKELRERRRELTARAADLDRGVAEVAALAAVADFNQIARRLRLPEIADLGEAAVAGDPEAAARIDTLIAQARRQTELTSARTRSQVAALDQSLTGLERGLETQSEALVELRQLEREAEASRLIYESFLSRLKETSVQEGIQQPDARLLSDAWVPKLPSSPNVPAVLGLAAIAGLFGAISWVVLRERMNATFRTADDLEARTGLAVLGTIPVAVLPKRPQFLDFLARRPGSSFAEATRNLRTSVMLANVDNPAQVVMISSGLPGEGKTTTAIALAHISRSLGKSVLIMECDLRRRNFRRYFKIDHAA
ncbi:MAG: exopolysaccharide transport family protein, partial [Pseudomonadota bacterium]